MADELPIEIDIEEAAVLRAAGAPEIRWIDCREPDEWEICHLEGAELVPLSGFAEKAPAAFTDPAQRIIVYCHHGMRSLRATQWLRQRGMPQTQSLRGGIDRWAELVDPAMRRY